MNRKQLDHFKDLIEREIAEFAQDSDAQLQGQSIVELDQQAVGRLSRMDALQSQAMAKAAARPARYAPECCAFAD